MRTSSSRRAGFTLVELLVTLAIMSVLMVGVAMVAIAQTEAYELNARTRETVSSNRSALTFIDRKLRMAGYGVNPQVTFDFGLPGAIVDRDRTDGPDELVFFARDPRFNRRVTVAGNSLTLAAPLTQPLHPGQVLLVICQSGDQATYVTVDALATGNTVQLMSPVAGNPFPRQAPPACPDQAFVLKVDRYRLFVADVREGDQVRPYLFLDQGLRRSGAARAYDATRHRYTELRDSAPGNGATELTADDLTHLVPLAADVDDFQVAYLMNRPDSAWGLAVATAEESFILGDEAADAEPDPAALAPLYDTSYRDPLRFTLHPANIRGVRLTLVTRSDRRFDRLTARPAVENRAAQPADTYYRTTVSTQVFVRNMLSRSEFAPLQIATLPGGTP